MQQTVRTPTTAEARVRVVPQVLMCDRGLEVELRRAPSAPGGGDSRHSDARAGPECACVRGAFDPSRKHVWIGSCRLEHGTSGMPWGSTSSTTTESDSARAGQSTDRGHGGDRHSRSRAATPAPRWAAQFLRTRSVISASAEKWNLPGLLNYYERAA
jgi:hypothetical protein